MPLSRRSLIGIGGLVAGGLVAGSVGCSAGDEDSTPDPYCVPRGDVTAHSRLAGARLVYDITGRPTSFRFDDGFYTQLGDWLRDYRRLSGTRAPDQVWTYGSWLAGQPRCDSWHDAGRAFDLSRLVSGGSVQVSCRYDIWKDYRGSRLESFRTRYWALAASLHLHFAYVLTYLYNATHHNHIHIDNGRSGRGMSTFSTDSPTQVQAVQGMLTHVWHQSLPITGEWDDRTADGTRAVLDRVGLSGSVDDGTDQWRGFLRTTAAEPAG